jgi:phosphohistidine phosphatase
MRRLLLLRHAKTEIALPGQDDRGRVLVERGRKEAAQMGAYLASHRLVPDRAILSPSARTQETWKHLAAAMGKAPGPQTLEEIYDATPDDIFDAVAGTPAEVPSLLILGHNPGVHEAALTLIASGDIDAREALREALPTAGLVVIDFAYDDWAKLHPLSGRLERFVTPKALDLAPR